MGRGGLEIRVGGHVFVHMLLRVGNAYFMYLYTNFAFGSRTEFWITIIPTVIGFIIPILTLVVVYVECKKEEKNESWTYIKYKKSYKGLESHDIR